MMTSLVSLRLAHSLLTLECGLTALLYLHSPSILFNHSVPGRGIICSSDEIIIQARQYDLQWLVAALLSFEAAINTRLPLTPELFPHRWPNLTFGRLYSLPISLSLRKVLNDDPLRSSDSSARLLKD